MITDIPLDSETRRRLGLLFVATALMLAGFWLRRRYAGKLEGSG